MGWSTFLSGHGDGRRIRGARRWLTSAIRRLVHAGWDVAAIVALEVALKVVSCVLHLC